MTTDDFLPGPGRITEHPTGIEAAIRSDTGPAVEFTRAPDTGPMLPLSSIDPILRAMSRSGRADVMEAIGDVLDPVQRATPNVSPRAVAHVLRVLAARERRS